MPYLRPCFSAPAAQNDELDAGELCSRSKKRLRLLANRHQNLPASLPYTEQEPQQSGRITPTSPVAGLPAQVRVLG